LRNKLRFAFSLLAASVVFLPSLPAGAAGLKTPGLRSPFEKAIELAVGDYSAPNAPQTKGPVRILGGITPHHDLALPMIVRFYEHIASREVRRVWLFLPGKEIGCRL
jgi:hypothetical protein